MSTKPEPVVAANPLEEALAQEKVARAQVEFALMRSEALVNAFSLSAALAERGPLAFSMALLRSHGVNVEPGVAKPPE